MRPFAQAEARGDGACDGGILPGAVSARGRSGRIATTLRIEPRCCRFEIKHALGNIALGGIALGQIAGMGSRSAGIPDDKVTRSKAQAGKEIPAWEGLGLRAAGAVLGRPPSLM